MLARARIKAVTRTGAAVAGIVVLSGCGGEDEQAATQPRPHSALARKAPKKPASEAPAKTEFLRKADALCGEAKQRVAPIAAAVAAKRAREDAAGVAGELRKGIPIADQLLGRMRALTPPKGDEAILAGYLDIIEEQKERIRPLAEALEAEDISTIEVLVAELRQGSSRVRRLARGYGFAKCGPEGLPTR